MCQVHMAPDGFLKSLKLTAVPEANGMNLWTISCSGRAGLVREPTFLKVYNISDDSDGSATI